MTSPDTLKGDSTSLISRQASFRTLSAKKYSSRFSGLFSIRRERLIRSVVNMAVLLYCLFTLVPETKTQRLVNSLDAGHRTHP